MKTVKDLEKDAYKVIGKELGYKNPMRSPRIKKVAIAIATGSAMKKDQKRNDLVVDRIAKITGQKASVRGAKKSVASFKIRESDPIGVLVTLRGKRMYDFLDKLLSVALPRTKDFRGLDAKAVDSIGNLTIGIKEHTIFPETPDEDIRDVFGMAVTIVTTAKDKKEATAFFSHIGVPFKK